MKIRLPRPRSPQDRSSSKRCYGHNRWAAASGALMGTGTAIYFTLILLIIRGL